MPASGTMLGLSAVASSQSPEHPPPSARASLPPSAASGPPDSTPPSAKGTPLPVSGWPASSSPVPGMPVSWVLPSGPPSVSPGAAVLLLLQPWTSSAQANARDILMIFSLSYRCRSGPRRWWVPVSKKCEKDTRSVHRARDRRPENIEFAVHRGDVGDHSVARGRDHHARSPDEPRRLPRHAHRAPLRE
jgi:hypothetical protein